MLKKLFCITILLTGCVNIQIVEDKQINIGIVTDDRFDEFINYYKDELENKLGDTYKVDYVLSDNLMKDIERYINLDADIIVIDSSEKDHTAYINKCISKEIGCIFINNNNFENDLDVYHKETPVLVSDHRQIGKKINEYLSQLDDKGDTNNDKILKYAFFSSNDDEYDLDILDSFIESANIDIEELIKQRAYYSYHNGYQVTSDLFIKHNNEVELIISQNQEITRGVIDVVDETSVISINGYEYIDKIDENNISANIFVDYKKYALITLELIDNLLAQKNEQAINMIDYYVEYKVKEKEDKE